MEEKASKLLCDSPQCKSFSARRNQTYFRLGRCRHTFCELCIGNSTSKRDDINIICNICRTPNPIEKSASYVVSSVRFMVPGVMGLRNQEWSCYINVLIQVLGQTPGLMKHLFDKINKSKCSFEETSVTNSLLNLLYGVNASETHVIDKESNDIGICNLRAKMKESDPTFDCWQQNDCHSFLLSLVSYIQKEIGEDSTDIIEGKLQSVFTYSNCHHVDKSELQTFTSLLIPVSETIKSVDEGLKVLLNEETFSEQSSMMCCRQCNEPEKPSVCTKRVTIRKCPDILVLQLARFQEMASRHDPRRKTINKYTGRVAFSKVLSLPIGNGKSLNNVQYSLYGIISHQGTLEVGHFTAFVKRLSDTEHRGRSHSSTQEGVDNWYRYNDRRVTKLAGQRELCDIDDAYLLFYHKN